MCDMAFMAVTTSLAAAGIGAFDVLISVVGFGAILTVVVALFGHRGRPEVSPQRQIAIAMGQGDRRTVFENPALAPLMWLLVQVAQKLSLPGVKRRLRRQLLAAGSPNFLTADEYLALAMLWGLGGGAVLLLVDYLLSGRLSPASLLVGVVLGAAVPIYYLHDLARRRLRDVARRVPYSLDLIALAMGAGSTFTEAIRTVVREDPQTPLNVELTTVLAEMDLGATRRQALTNLVTRVPLESLQSIIASVLQAEELGTPLSDVLRDQAALLRLHRSVRAEKAAAVASVRILIPGVLILLSVVLTIFAPFIVRAVKGELFY